jgi:hypothetical protein
MRHVIKFAKTIVKFTHRSKTVFTVIYWSFVTLLLFIAQPIKTHAWNTVVQQGNQALLDRQFNLAITEYKKLKLIRINSSEPQKFIDRAINGQNNILFLKDFYYENNSQTNIELIAQATNTYTSAETATAACQDLAIRNEPELARICLDKTTSLWPTYRDAWITYYYITTDEAQRSYIKEKIVIIDPSYTFEVPN